MRYWIVKWIVDHWVGRLLLTRYKDETARGNSHEALHCIGAVVHGNSQWCNGKCYEEHHGYTEYEYMHDIAKWSQK